MREQEAANKLMDYRGKIQIRTSPLSPSLMYLHNGLSVINGGCMLSEMYCHLPLHSKGASKDLVEKKNLSKYCFEYHELWAFTLNFVIFTCHKVCTCIYIVCSKHH